MEEIKIGEYIRTEDGYIGKLVEYIPNALNYLKIDIGIIIRHADNTCDYFIYTRYGFQLKHSPNIIDLIEVGDYVNGYKVKYVCNKEPCPSGKYVDVDCELDSSESYFFDNEIKSIVTKEQFAAAEYRLED